MSLRSKAMRFAEEAHRGVTRRYTGEPYVTHPFNVAMLVSTATADEEVVAAALLHDVLEDTAVSLDEITAAFGPRVAALVVEVTDVYTAKRHPDLNRVSRKALERERLATVSNEAKTIKLADLVDNTGSIMTHDPNFGRVYLKEKELLLEALGGGDERLMSLARNLIAAYREK
jgi:(p)ppGpp synthase/HD superfamily hydrolase